MSSRHPRVWTGLAALALLAHAMVAAADPPCAPCPNGTTQVSIMIESQEIWNDSGQRIASNTNFWAYRPSSVPNGNPGGDPIVVSSASQIRAKILELAASCKRIKFLLFSSHGSPGAIYMNDMLNINNANSIFDGLSCAMAPNAEVRFDGCNVGRGCRGEDMLARLATLLLRPGGGSLRAPTYYSSTPLPIIPGFSGNLDTQILTVGPGLTNPQWDNTPKTAAYCRGYVDNALARVREWQRIGAACPDTAYTPVINQAIGDLMSADAGLAPSYLLGGSRPRLDNSYGYDYTANHLQLGMQNYEFLLAHEPQLPNCPPADPNTHDAGVPSAGVPNP